MFCIGVSVRKKDLRQKLVMRAEHCDKALIIVLTHHATRHSFMMDGELGPLWEI